MERNKYREQIQNSVSTPSDDSWGKLDKKLNNHDNHKINKKRLLIKYAVSALIIISIAPYLFQTENKITRDEISANPKVEKSSIKFPVANSEPDATPDSAIENSYKIKLAETNSPPIETINYELNENWSIKDEDGVEEDKNYLRVMPKYFTTVSLNENSKIAQQNMKTEDEVEALLKNAILKTEKNDSYLNITKISALDLLAEIEDDLEKDSRRKLFEKIIITIKNPTEIEITDRSK